MGKFIKITPDLEVSAVEWPEGANYKFLQKQIGGHIEHVRPRRLYPLLQTYNLRENYCLLVDEEGIIKNLPFNPFGSYLYGTDQHDCPIVGSVLIVQETEDDFAVIPDHDLEELLCMVKALVKKLTKGAIHNG